MITTTSRKRVKKSVNQGRVNTHPGTGLCSHGHRDEATAILGLQTLARDPTRTLGIRNAWIG